MLHIEKHLQQAPTLSLIKIKNNFSRANQSKLSIRLETEGTDSQKKKEIKATKYHQKQ